MNILRYSLFILLTCSSPGFAEPLHLIEEKLAVLINDVEKDDSQTSADIAPLLSEAATTTQDHSSIDTVRAPHFDFENVLITSESQTHPFSVQVGSSKSLQLSYRVASMLRTLGYPAFNSTIDLNNRGVWHRVYIGSFATRDGAQNVKERLFAENITEGFIRHFPYAIQVGSSGSFDQLTELRKTLLTKDHLPYSTPIQNASSGLIEGRLLIGACHMRENCDYLLSTIKDDGFSAVVVER